MIRVVALILFFSALIQSGRGGSRSYFVYIRIGAMASSTLLILLLAYHILQSAYTITFEIIVTATELLALSSRCSNMDKISAIDQA